ncbi:hypothetical protein [Hippea maritima]|uniref:Uncharacterized protein n=1 Tax=Hippea maritima (strain ATCC 700847 / DSM 10411 / MH2) TaxID=760142 RepID=F2LV45_HIPMA|nr:hypothetical protein [Hippea maritima]AEA33629.1 hypothetical protein Hipma_0659 [Hippea maritima DSM 10411]
MRAAVKSKPLFQTQESIEHDLPVLRSDADGYLFVGTIPDQGVYITNNSIVILIRDSFIEESIFGAAKISGRKRITYKNRGFYLKDDRIELNRTELSQDARMAIENYLTMDLITPLESKGINGIVEEFEKKGFALCWENFNLLKQYCPNGKTEFSYAFTLAAGANCYALIGKSSDYVVISNFCSIPEGYLSDSSFLKALVILGNKSYRAGYDSHGRLVLFSSDTAVTFPDIQNREMAGLCTEEPLDNYIYCGLTVSKDGKTIGDPCIGKWLEFNDKIENLLSKSATSTPLVSELCSDKATWKEVKQGDVNTINGINFRLTAKSEKLAKYVSIDGEIELKLNAKKNDRKKHR